MFKSAYIGLIGFGLTALGLSSCGTTPAPADNARNYTPIPKGALALPDRTVFSQKDPRWAHEKLGRTQTDTLGTDGCLVTATSMALGNLGFETNPSDLNARLTQVAGFTSRGWLIWDGIRKVTDNRAVAKFYDEVNEPTIQQCLTDGYYPLVQFYLPNGRTHWAMIVQQSEKGFHMRDPLRTSNKPLIFPRSTDAFKAVRCVGLKA
jgi:hypothetical protein